MTKSEKMPGLLPVEEAARELGTTALNVMMHIKRRLLEGQEIEGKWYVTGESLAHCRLEGGVRPGAALCARSCTSKSGCGSCA